MRKEAAEERFNELADEHLEMKRQAARDENLNPADVHLTRADEANLRNKGESRA